MSVVTELVVQMDLNRVATRGIFGEKMGAAVTDAVSKMDAAIAAKTAADAAAASADAAALATYTSEKDAAEAAIIQAISDLQSNSDVADYADSMAELKAEIENDQASATAALLAYVTDETAKTNQLITDFGTLAEFEAEFVGFLGGA